MSASRQYSRSNPLNSLFLLACALLLVSSVPVMGQSDSATTLSGRLGVIFGDDFESGESWIDFYLTDTDGRWVSVDIPNEVIAQAGGLSELVGQFISVTIDSDSSIVEQLEFDSTRLVYLNHFSVPLPPETNWLNLLCEFPNTILTPDPATSSQIQNLISGTSYPSIRHYINRMSHGAHTVLSTSRDWAVLPLANFVYYPYSLDYKLEFLWTDCLQAHGINPNQNLNINLFFDEQVFGIPGLSLQAWSAVSPVGEFIHRITWLDSQVFPPNGNRRQSIIAHEMGHALGMPHSDNSDGDADTYDNAWDIMSNPKTGKVFQSFGEIAQPSNSYHYLRLGWIPESNVYDVPSDGQPHTIWIDDWRVNPTSNYYSAVIKLNGLKRGYSIEARDGRSSAGQYYEGMPDASGVLVYNFDDLRSDAWALLEGATDPNELDIAFAPLLVGESYNSVPSLAGPLKVEVLQKVSNSYQVRITWGFPPSPGNTLTPSPTVTRPPSGTATPIPTLTAVPPLPDCNTFSFSGIALFGNAHCQDSSLGMQIIGYYELSQYGMANLASSIYIPSGWSAAVWRGPNRTGLYKCLTGTVTNFSDITFDNSGFQLENDVESMEVKNTQNCDSLPGFSSHGRVYTDMNFGGGACDATSLDTLIWVDGSCGQVSSVRVASGRSMRLYKSLSGTGPSWCFNGEDPYLGDNLFDDGSPMNDQVNAFKAFSMQDCVSATPTPVTPTLSPTPVTLTATPPGWISGDGLGLRGTYYRTVNLSDVSFSRIDPYLDFYWDGGAPQSGGSIGTDNFSVRWTGYVEAPNTGTYQFCTSSDDGSRLWVNEVNIVDKWSGGAETETCGNIDLSAGQFYSVRMEYWEGGGGAAVRLRWTVPGQSKVIIPQSYLYPDWPNLLPESTSVPTPTAIPVTGNGLSGDYYNGTSFDTFVFSRNDPNLNFDWSGSSPGSGVNPDNFSVRWTGYLVPPTSGNYMLRLSSDDRSRMWIDGRLLINNWDCCSTAYASEVLSAGRAHAIQIEFREYTGGAWIILEWIPPNGSLNLIPQSSLYSSAIEPTATYTPSQTPLPSLTPSLTPTPPPPAQNDYPANVAFVDSIVSSFNSITLGATTSGDEPTTACGYNVGKTVWYRWVGPGLTNAHVTTKGSNYDTVLAVYVQDNGQWIELGCSDDADEDLSSAVDIVAMTADVYFMVGGYGGAGGTLNITFDERNLLLNGEFDAGGKQPEQWTISSATGGRRKCPLVGDCYYVFNANQPAISILKQKRNIWGVIPGDLLDVSTLVSGNGLASGAKLKIKLLFEDGSSAPLVVKFPSVNLPGEQLVSEQILVSGIVDKLIAKVSRNPGAGKLNVDDIRVVHIIPDVFRDVRNTLSTRDTAVANKAQPRLLPTAPSP